MLVRRPSLIALVSLALMAVLSSLSLWAILQMRRDALDAARSSAHNIAVLVQHDVQRNLDLYDMTLAALAHAHREPELRALPETVRDSLLRDYSAQARGLGSVFIANAQGRITFGLGKQLPEQADITQREYFQVQSRGASPRLFISHPYTPQASAAQPSVALSRRLEHPDGSFAGVAAATLRLDYFRELFSGLALEPGATLQLRMLDGTALAGWPDTEGQPAADQAFRSHLRDGANGFFGNAADGTEHWYDFRRIGEYPLVFEVALPSREIYADWRSRAWVIGLLALALDLAMVAVTLLAIRQLRRRNAEVDELTVAASTDPLTGLHNRRGFDLRSTLEWSRTQRSGQPLAVLLMDIDKFKAYNDHYGHPAGDAALQVTAEVIDSHARRPSDCAARYGGEEFVVLLGDTDERHALALAERIRASLQARALPHEHGPLGVLTLSIGVACSATSGADSLEALVKAADTALYDAKHGGRNRVAAYRPASATSL
ncbi:GGDEF domain-containing protein [Pseudomonas citronellolis]|uniref:GGDEF domain-containing protein n=1 Tax=Pseudomonas citronellolis TaxID=53408 RepID=UPI0023E475AF|nr:diguanylate cyclase [Pseudomonas citronellolis]MDF3935803.1 diguanylate cyclase [Pseudomonas citronellolis]